MFARPIIVLNKDIRGWRHTLVHEMLHVAEPELAHGAVFEILVRRYVRIANRRRKIKARVEIPPSEEKHVE
jgi:predicted metal-dependent hydrolase